MHDDHHCDILLVEDNSDDVFLFIRTARLEAPKMRVFPLTDAAAAQDFLCCVGQFSGRVDSVPPGLIITDLKMPKLAGHEFVKWARQQNFLKKVPVLVLSSSEDANDVSRAYQDGANSYLVKPSSADGYKALVRTIADYWCDNNLLPEGPFVRSPVSCPQAGQR